jgi:hypothetical protein
VERNIQHWLSSLPCVSERGYRHWTEMWRPSQAHKLYGRYIISLEIVVWIQHLQRAETACPETSFWQLILELRKTVQWKISDEGKSVTCLCGSESTGNVGDALSTGSFLIFSSTEWRQEENRALLLSQHGTNNSSMFAKDSNPAPSRCRRILTHFSISPGCRQWHRGHGSYDTCGRVSAQVL